MPRPGAIQTRVVIRRCGAYRDRWNTSTNCADDSLQNRNPYFVAGHFSVGRDAVRNVEVVTIPCSVLPWIRPANAYVAGITQSSEFSVKNAFQAIKSASGQNSGFVAKLNPAGSALVYSTLGGAPPIPPSESRALSELPSIRWERLRNRRYRLAGFSGGQRISAISVAAAVRLRIPLQHIRDEVRSLRQFAGIFHLDRWRLYRRVRLRHRG
jgi:hypothetical protein